MNRKSNHKNNSDYTGHIRQRANGLWEGRYYVDGEQKSIYNRCEKELREKLNKLYGAILDGSHIDETQDTVGYFLKDWLEQYARPNIRPSSYLSYRGYIYQHIDPVLGKKKLKKLNLPELQDFFNQKSAGGRLDGKKGGLATKTLQNIRNMLHSAFKQACILRTLQYNPIIGVSIPQYGKTRKTRVFDEQEIEQLQNYIRTDNSVVAKGIQLLLHTGLRLGELLALRWDYVDFFDESLNIRFTLDRLYNEEANRPDYQRIDSWADKNNLTGLYLGPVKTDKGNRRVYFTPQVLEELEKLKKNQLEIMKYLGHTSKTFNPHGFVICNELGRPLDPKFFSGEYKKLVKAARLAPANVHATRHTFATNLLKRSQDIVTISEILGHASTSTTLNMYGHTFDERKRKAMSLLE